LQSWDFRFENGRSKGELEEVRERLAGLDMQHDRERQQLRWWSIPGPNSVMNADRNVFRMLSTHYRGAPTNRHSVFYKITETDSMHPHRLKMIGQQRYHAAGKRSE
jgi:hypothetical protein